MYHPQEHAEETFTFIRLLHQGHCLSNILRSVLKNPLDISAFRVGFTLNRPYHSGKALVSFDQFLHRLTAAWSANQEFKLLHFSQAVGEAFQSRQEQESECKTSSVG